MRTEFWLHKLKIRNHSEDINTDGMDNIKRDF
jgi:hypothetical protein